jgi:plastocyanin
MEVVNPAVTVTDQPIVDGSITVGEAISNGPGWLVIHAQQDGRPGSVLGYSALADGSNADVKVAIDVEAATETLYAMLHMDSGQIGIYEFPGDDVPVTVDGSVVTPAFMVTGGLPSADVPSVTVQDQEISEANVLIAEAVSVGPGWLVIHAQQDGRPGPVLGFAALEDGLNQDVSVEIDTANVTAVLYAMLHTDAGQIGTYEFPGDDIPVTVDDQVVSPSFGVQSPVEEATGLSIEVADQGLEDGTVTVAQVVSEGPGWLVIHAQQDGSPGPVLGYSPVEHGANQGVVVEIDLLGVTGVLYAMLHTDAGEVGTYEFPGDDTPVTVDDQVVMSAFDLTAPTDEVQVEMIDFAFAPKIVVVKVGATVAWPNQDGAIEHTTTSDTGIWDSGLYAGGESFSFTFDEPGIYPYYCVPHGAPGGVGMAGTVVVIP